MLRAGRLGRAVLVAAVFAIVGEAAIDCQTTTCEETATCPDPPGSPADAAAPSDASDGGCGSVEDCTNGIDDDCNGLVDCADPACTRGFQCVASAPAGWSGPAVLVEGDGGEDASALPVCPDGYGVDAVEGTLDPSAPSAACSCACDAPSNGACAGSVTFYYDSSCQNPCAEASLAADACVATCAGAQTMRVNAEAGDGGACAPHPSVRVPPVAWGTVARVCAVAASGDAPGGCAAGQVCVAKAASPFASGTCVWQSGSAACPDPSQTQHVYFTAGTDTRGCTACTCGSPENVTCGDVPATTYTDTACTMGGAPVDEDAGCVAAPAGAHGVETTANATSGGGSCAPGAVSSTGSFTGSGATTVCCSN